MFLIGTNGYLADEGQLLTFASSVADVSHLLPCVPPEDLPALLLVHADMAIKLDGVAHNQALNLPGITKCQPVVWLLVLEAVHNALQHADSRAGTCKAACWQLPHARNNHIYQRRG